MNEFGYSATSRSTRGEPNRITVAPMRSSRRSRARRRSCAPSRPRFGWIAVSFEASPPDASELARRIERLLKPGLPGGRGRHDVTALPTWHPPHTRALPLGAEVSVYSTSARGAGGLAAGSTRAPARPRRARLQRPPGRIALPTRRARLAAGAGSTCRRLPPIGSRPAPGGRRLVAEAPAAGRRPAHELN